ncbi:mitotic-spindle organizing protein 2-like [Actinia tenebrosa]|uniref:Mitotic-spindle organizing protein 2-like n=1 Tax=Actinia tenebrosa TaxID=6105 RepID=A0A6P8J3R5_ACTTE|nr:mitotic-spindle organizing protein 2-like [Actinia tenebrosa]
MSRSASNSDVYRVALTRMNPKTVDEELLEVCKLSGVKMDSEVFKIILDLIKLNVSPTALVQVLRKVAASKGDDSRGTSKGSIGSQSDITQASQSDSSLQTRTDTSALTYRLKELKAQMQTGV